MTTCIARHRAAGIGDLRRAGRRRRRDRSGSRGRCRLTRLPHRADRSRDFAKAPPAARPSSCTAAFAICSRATRPGARGLRERETLRRNAPHLVHELRFVVPAYRWLDLAFYGAGLKAYDLLAGATGAWRTAASSPARARRCTAPRVARARASRRGALLRRPVRRRAPGDGARAHRRRSRGGAGELRARDGIRSSRRRTAVAGVDALDQKRAAAFTIRARAVINATGIFVDALRSLDDRRRAPLLAFSRGSHIVVGADALDAPAQRPPRCWCRRPGRPGALRPALARSRAGRYDGCCRRRTAGRSRPVSRRGRLSLETVNRYLSVRCHRDVLAGLRRAAAAGERKEDARRTSHEHVIDVCPSGLVTITGGKWTTYRAMGEHAVTSPPRRRRTPSPTAVAADGAVRVCTARTPAHVTTRCESTAGRPRRRRAGRQRSGSARAAAPAFAVHGGSGRLRRPRRDGAFGRRRPLAAHARDVARRRGRPRERARRRRASRTRARTRRRMATA